MPPADSPRSMPNFSGFIEFLSSGHYDAAATYTVNSPRGILYNKEALKYLKCKNLIVGSILLLAALNSSTAAGHLPNSAVTLEAIKCALSEKPLNLIHWIILNDTVCTLEDCNKIAIACAENKHGKLSHKILSILTSQDGVFENLQSKDARIMEHVFW
ncbi:clathrin heavy chain linker domain-containing protein 1 [Pterocles gutturalis]